ncbi:MaoC/PaaZ C-terminal domain-containing protein [Streptosporangium carneum]|uniref:3-alpha,7-alpha, 12-alpha-trihydroxy-5-beta-choles t-24-enoyl-CoA hydratase n=1 Tax=Streptosporangium carneum TaxID=47481 RepID=A0A9W6MFG4_9ACTN|nr:MaoC/PaaZ C-terminal domain-containing protein [Streptosporangium carneum]GLK12609.1 3-alpha,7-alpha,12-alpha-trihydroxy-5-beta-choles t-24-enoyl-CoA hydratase [Streptosporangium carneum]
MPIDVATVLCAPPSTRELRWTRRDVLLYHLSLGAGRNTRNTAGNTEGNAAGDIMADPEPRYTFERDLQVLPTFAMVAGQGVSAGDGPAPAMRLPGVDVDLRRILHAGQSLTVHRALPVAGTATLTTRVAHLWDKGKAAVIVLEHTAADPDGTPLWSTEMQIWARGEGGFGGEPGPQQVWAAPGREPDHVLDSPTTTDQALLYRLNGDLNPLHADPEFARAAGFASPILHGLASYGIVAKAVVDDLLDGDAVRLRSLSARFAGSIHPGQTLRTSVWRDGDRLTLEATCPERDGAPVLSYATAEIVS